MTIGAMPDAAREKSAPQRAMHKLGLVRDIDLALHLPLRYEDETRVTRLADAHEGQTVQVEATVAESRVEFRPRRQLVARLLDADGQVLVLRFLNFYPSQQKALAAGVRLRVRGELRGGFLGREMVHPAVKPAGAALPTALTPVYPTSAQLPQAYLRKAVTSALARAALHEVLPPDTVPGGLPSLHDALHLLHQPPPGAPLAALEDRSHPAWQRLKFDELLAQQLSQLSAQRERALLHAPALVAVRGGLHERLLAALPFRLTAAQARVGGEIAADLARGQPMHRLLQGDVGSGKTVVAALAAAIAIDSGWQCALMAPTEILAEQHFRKLVYWLEPLGVTVAWLTGSRKGKGRKAMLEAVASGRAGLVVGTHAVIQHDVVFARLGLAVVDEQHRFGVAQRLALRDKLGAGSATTTPSRRTPRGGGAAQRRLWGPNLEPHLLMMSATPIPRTLAMTYFADLAVSTIDELPPGRTPVLTKLFADGRRDEVIARIRDEVAQGKQVYWVCPLIEESEALDLRNATETHQQLSAALPGVNVGLLHGRLPAPEKAAVMAAVRRRADAAAGGHDGDRGRRRRAQRQPDGDRARRALRPVAAAPVARPRRSRRGGQRVRAALHRAAVADGQGTAARDSAKPTTASRSRAATSRSAAPASSWARARVATRCCALPTSAHDNALLEHARRVAPTTAGRTPGGGGSAGAALAGVAGGLLEGLSRASSTAMG